MRNSMPAAVLGALAMACAPAEDEPAASTAEPIAVADAGFATPESMLHDPAADVYLVTNINGIPSDKDDNGFISRVSPEGAVLALKWVDGASEDVTLHAPKGMALKGDTLFVADIDVVRLFHRTSGAPLAAREVPGASFLNDVAVGPDGTVYVTDTGIRLTADGMEETGADAVYRFENDRPVVVVSGAALGRPNGILADSAGIIVVTFGSGTVFRVNPETGERTDLPIPPQGGLDGVVRLPDGGLVVSSWNGSSLYHLAGDQFGAIGDSVPTPADIGYDAVRGRVLIPVFTENRLLIRAISGSHQH
jgi:sugar lactone lactonase YvrE